MKFRNGGNFTPHENYIFLTQCLRLADRAVGAGWRVEGGLNEDKQTSESNSYFIYVQVKT